MIFRNLFFCIDFGNRYVNSVQYAMKAINFFLLTLLKKLFPINPIYIYIYIYKCLNEQVLLRCLVAHCHLYNKKQKTENSKGNSNVHGNPRQLYDISVVLIPGH